MLLLVALLAVMALVTAACGSTSAKEQSTGDATGCLAAGPALHAELARELDR